MYLQLQHYLAETALSLTLTHYDSCVKANWKHPQEMYFLVYENKEATSLLCWLLNCSGINSFISADKEAPWPKWHLCWGPALHSLWAGAGFYLICSEWGLENRTVFFQSRTCDAYTHLRNVMKLYYPCEAGCCDTGWTSQVSTPWLCALGHLHWNGASALFVQSCHQARLQHI